MTHLLVCEHQKILREVKPDSFIYMHMKCIGPGKYVKSISGHNSKPSLIAKFIDL